MTRFDTLRGAPDAHAIADGLILRNTVGKLSWTVALGGLAILLIGLARARGQPPDERAKIRHDKGKPIFDDLEAWLHAQLPKISGKSPLAKAIRYGLTRMKQLTHDDAGRSNRDRCDFGGEVARIRIVEGKTGSASV